LSFERTINPRNFFDEWIARVVCFAFSVSPQPFINQMNRSTSETQSQMSNEEGLQPILAWRNETVVDPTVQRENLVALVNAGIMTRRRAAQIMGEILPDDPMADVLAITTGQGVAKLQQNWSANDEKKFSRKRFSPARSTNIATINLGMIAADGRMVETSEKRPMRSQERARAHQIALHNRIIRQIDPEHIWKTRQPM